MLTYKTNSSGDKVTGVVQQSELCSRMTGVSTLLSDIVRSHV